MGSQQSAVPEDSPTKQDSCEEAEGFQQAHGDAQVKPTECAIACPTRNPSREDSTTRLPEGLQSEPLDYLQGQWNAQSFPQRLLCDCIA